MRKSTISLGMFLILVAAGRAGAASITIPENGGCGYFGEPNTAYVGQTFQALPGLADQFSFMLNDTGVDTDATGFHVLIAEWEGSSPGTVLFESGDLSTVYAGGRQDFTVNLGGLDLVDGATYAVLLDAFVLFDDEDGSTNFGCDNGGSYAGGNLVFLNIDGGDRTSHFADSWNYFEGVDLMMTLTFTECGNAVVEVGEDCDDGNTVGGDCCSTTCQYELLGSTCDDGNACTVGDTCSSGTCLPGEAADCDDGDLCTVDSCDEESGCHSDGIPVAAEACHKPGKAMFLVVDASAKKVKWLWKQGEVVLPADLGAPAVDTGYALCVFDRSGGVPELVASYSVPAGPSAWIVKPAMVKYLDKSGSADGITLAKAKAVELPAKSSFLVKGGGLSLVLPAPYNGSEFFDVDTSLTVQALNSVGACWTSDLLTVKKNTATKFKAVAP